MNTATFKIEGMHCDGCAANIQSLLERQVGAKKVGASFNESEVRVLYDPQTINEEQLAAVIEHAGFRVVSLSHS